MHVMSQIFYWWFRVFLLCRIFWVQTAITWQPDIFGWYVNQHDSLTIMIPRRLKTIAAPVLYVCCGALVVNIFCLLLLTKAVGIISGIKWITPFNNKGTMPVWHTWFHNHAMKMSIIGCTWSACTPPRKVRGGGGGGRGKKWRAGSVEIFRLETTGRNTTSSPLQILLMAHHTRVVCTHLRFWLHNDMISGI